MQRYGGVGDDEVRNNSHIHSVVVAVVEREVGAERSSHSHIAVGRQERGLEEGAGGGCVEGEAEEHSGVADAVDGGRRDRMPMPVPAEVPKPAVGLGRAGEGAPVQKAGCIGIVGQVVEVDGEHVAGAVEAGGRYNDGWEARNDGTVEEERNEREDHSGMGVVAQWWMVSSNDGHMGAGQEEAQTNSANVRSVPAHEVDQMLHLDWKQKDAVQRGQDQ